MHRVVGLLVLMFAAAILVTAMAQPASAYYNPQEKEESRKAEENKLGLKKLVEENERLRTSLDAVREKTCRVQKELDEMKYRLLQLRNAVMLRNKLKAALASRGVKNNVCTDKQTELQPEEQVLEVVAHHGDNGATANHGAEAKTVVDEDKSPETPERLPGIVNRFLHSGQVKRVKDFVEQIVMRYYPSTPNAFGTLSRGVDSHVEPVKPELNETSQDLEPLRSRMNALKSRLKSALDAKCMSRKNISKTNAPERSSEIQVPKKLRERILKQLRSNFNEELNRKMRELKRDMQNSRRVAMRRSAWF